MFGIPKKASAMFKTITFMVAMAFIVALLGVDMLRAKTSHAALLNLPEPGQILSLSRAYEMPQLKGLKFDPLNPLNVSFFIDPGSRTDMKQEDAAKLVQYFLAALTIPEEDVWVNLSPYENDRIVNDDLAVTDLGRDLLAQDYILKQLSASLSNPETTLGKDYWESTYQTIMQENGASSMPVNTFNKVWILPQTAEVYEENGLALITEAKLTAMLEEDYLALENGVAEIQNNDYITEDEIEKRSSASSQMMKKLLLPKVIEDVNQGKNFANLRQIYNAQILAAWFKNKFEDSFYANYINGKKTGGIDTVEKQEKEKIFNLYVDAFKKGVYDYVKKEYDAQTKQNVKKRYFSGGYISSSIRTDIKPGLRVKAMQKFGEIKKMFRLDQLVRDSNGKSIKLNNPGSTKNVVGLAAMLAAASMAADSTSIDDYVGQTQKDYAHVTEVLGRSNNLADIAQFSLTKDNLAAANMIAEVNRAATDNDSLNIGHGPNPIGDVSGWSQANIISESYDSLARSETDEDVKVYYQDVSRYFAKVFYFQQRRNIRRSAAQDQKDGALNQAAYSSYINRQAESQPLVDSLMEIKNFMELLASGGSILEGQSAQDSAAIILNGYQLAVDSLGMSINGVVDTSLILDDSTHSALITEQNNLVKDTTYWSATLNNPNTAAMITSLQNEFDSLQAYIDTVSNSVDEEIAVENQTGVWGVLGPYKTMQSDLEKAIIRLGEIDDEFKKGKQNELNDPKYYTHKRDSLYEAAMILATANKTAISYQQWLLNRAKRENDMNALAAANAIAAANNKLIDLGAQILSTESDILYEVLNLQDEGKEIHARGEELKADTSKTVFQFADARIVESLGQSETGVDVTVTGGNQGVRGGLTVQNLGRNNGIGAPIQAQVGLGARGSYGSNFSNALGAMDIDIHSLRANRASHTEFNFALGGGAYSAANNVHNDLFSTQSDENGEVSNRHGFTDIRFDAATSHLIRLNPNASLSLGAVNFMLARIGATGDNIVRTNKGEFVNLSAAQLAMLFNNEGNGMAGPFLNASVAVNNGQTDVNVDGNKSEHNVNEVAPAMEAGVLVNVNDLRMTLSYMERFENSNRGLKAKFDSQDGEKVDWSASYQIDFENWTNTVGGALTFRGLNHFDWTLGANMAFKELLEGNINRGGVNTRFDHSTGGSFGIGWSNNEGVNQFEVSASMDMRRFSGSKRNARADRRERTANEAVKAQFNAVNHMEVDAYMSQDALVEQYLDQPAFIYIQGDSLISMDGAQFMQNLKDGNLWAASYNYDLSNASLALNVGSENTNFEVVKTEQNSRMLNEGGATILADMYSKYHVVHQSMSNNKYRLEFKTDAEFFNDFQALSPRLLSETSEIVKGNMRFEISETMADSVVKSIIHVKLSDSSQTMMSDLLNSTQTDIKVRDAENSPVVALALTADGTDLSPVTAEAYQYYEKLTPGTTIPGRGRVVQQGEVFYRVGENQYMPMIINAELIANIGSLSTVEANLPEINTIPQEGEIIDISDTTSADTVSVENVVTVDSSNVKSAEEQLVDEINTMTFAKIMDGKSGNSLSNSVRAVLQGIDSLNLSVADISSGNITYYNDFATFKKDGQTYVVQRADNGIAKIFATNMEYNAVRDQFTVPADKRTEEQDFVDAETGVIYKVGTRTPLSAADVFADVPMLKQSSGVYTDTKGGIDLNSVRSMVKTAAGSSVTAMPKLDMAGLDGLSLETVNFQETTGAKILANV